MAKAINQDMLNYIALREKRQQAEIDEAVQKSIKRFNTVNRVSLGLMMFNEEIFHLADAHFYEELAYPENTVKVVYIAPIKDKLDRLLIEKYDSVDAPQRYDHVLAEVCLSYILSGNDSIKTHINKRLAVDIKLKHRVELLTRAHNNPTFVPYYVAGITDDLLIARYITDDIDPSLALSISL